MLNEMPSRFRDNIDASEECWLWTGPLNDAGYGRVYFNKRQTRAHIMAYTLLIGPVPDGLELDHLCRVRRCANPEHLEPVTHGENMRRAFAARTEARNGVCPAGRHVIAEVGEYLWACGKKCKACHRERNASGTLRSKLVCGQGHPRTPDNTIIRRAGNPACKPCVYEQNRAAYYRRKARRAAST